MSGARPRRLRVTLTFRDQHSTVPPDGVHVNLIGVVDLPLGLGCLRSYAESDPSLASRLTMTNLMFPSSAAEEEMADRLLETKPDLIGFSCYVLNAEVFYRVCERIKSRAPDVLLVVGGPEIPREGCEQEVFLESRPAIDAAVGGEGEEVFADLLRARLEGRPLETVPGLACRTKAGAVATVRRAYPRDLKAIPSPYLTGAVNIAPNQGGMLVLETSRGCVFNCSFCDYHLGRHAMDYFPLERVEKELDLLESRGFSGYVWFADPIINLKNAHFKDVLRLLKGRSGFRVILELYPEIFDEEALGLLGEIPPALVAVGIQSTDPRTLRNVDRPFDPERSARNIRGLLAHPNLEVVLELVLGLPGDDYDVFKRSLDWCLSFRPVPNLMVFDLCVFPNTPLFAQKDRFGIEVDAQGRALSCSTFSENDMRRASWLWGAFLALQAREGKGESLESFMARGSVRPSEALEGIAHVMRRSGRLPDARLRAY